MSPHPRESASPGRTGGLILAMDTSGREGSVAIGVLTGERGTGAGRLDVRARASLRAEEEHASLLVPRIQGILEELKAVPQDLSGLVVGSGPGSFTGVRVAGATAKGLAKALQIPLWAFSSLAAAAAETDRESLHPRVVLFDARGDRVYMAAYRVLHGAMDTLVAPVATTITQVLDELLPPGAILLGDGAQRHRALLEGAGVPVLPPPSGRPTAEGLLRVFALNPDTPPLDDPGRWEPEYLRESGAERMWKKRKAGPAMDGRSR